jgi:hypothetical protein
MARESLDLIIREDGSIAAEVRTPYSKPLWDFFRSHDIIPEAVYGNHVSTPLYEQANQAHFRMTRRGDRYVFGLTTVISANEHAAWGVAEYSYRDMIKRLFSYEKEPPTTKEVIARARDHGYEPVDENQDPPCFVHYRNNGNSKSNWSYDLTNNRIKVIKAPEPPEQKEQP